MAEIENIHCPICTQPIPSSRQNGLPPALATDERRGGYALYIVVEGCKFSFWRKLSEREGGRGRGLWCGLIAAIKLDMAL